MSADPTATAEELQAVVGALVRRMRAVSPGRDVTLSQVAILKRLERAGPHTVADIARLDKITHQSVAATVAALVERDLVRREADPADLRRKSLVITERGRVLLSDRREAGFAELAAAIADRLTPAEHADLDHALVLLRRLLE